MEKKGGGEEGKQRVWSGKSKGGVRPKATGGEGERGKAPVTREATGSDPPSRPQLSGLSLEKQLQRRKRGGGKKWEKGI